MADRGAPARGNDLGDFLRARRAALDLRRAGLPDDGRRRRVPGLRREELSQVANVSVDYIVRLEQDRTRRVSRPVLDALADSLQLSPDERTYLVSLAEVEPSSRTQQPAGPEVTPQLQQLLDVMHDIPAMVVYRRMEVLAWNRGAAVLLTDFRVLPPRERNLVRLMFLDNAFRTLYAAWPDAARDAVAVLRMEVGRHPDDPELTALVGELSTHDPDFATWWTSHPVHGLRAVTRAFHHPVVGTLTLVVHQLSVGTHLDLLLVAYTAAPDSPSREALRVLSGRASIPSTRRGTMPRTGAATPNRSLADALLGGMRATGHAVVTSRSDRRAASSRASSPWSAIAVAPSASAPGLAWPIVTSRSVTTRAPARRRSSARTSCANAPRRDLGDSFDLMASWTR